ncbi:chorismate-binding protein [Sorangium sp. So ce429]
MIAPEHEAMSSEHLGGKARGHAWQWLQALGERFPAERSEFSCCFERVDGADPSAWIAIGRLASIVCDVRDGAVVARLEAGSRLLSKQVSFLDGAELPYAKFFSVLASSLRTERALLPSLYPSWSTAEARNLKWFGGWKYLPSGSTVSKAACFNLPKLAIRIDAGGARTFNWGGLPSDVIDDVLRRVAKGIPRSPGEREAVIDDRMVPHRDAYLDAARSVLDALSRKECEKIVLSRKRVMEFSRTLDPIDVYSRLIGHGGHAFQYLMSIEGNETWVGISPELLLRRSGNGIQTRPLAGSRRRGDSAAQDERERESLLTSEKDGREHDIAAGHMFRRLQSICEGDSLEMSRGRDIAKLSYIQHLATEINGRLDPAYDAVDALTCIYPPATILGIPELSAERMLRSCEPFDRSFFTGGIGVLSSNGDCEIALCIRSAAVRGHELHLYAGSGYVEGSSPEDEWRETEAKMQPFVDVVDSLLEGPRGASARS